MQKEFVIVNEVPTKVLSWGKTLKDTSKNVSGENLNFIICIPGNPGITEFYVEFLEEIYRNTNNIVWIVGHAGHEMLNLQDMPPAKENKNLYSLQGQIKHKVSFIDDNVPKNAKITLIGHSIGAYVILKLLQVPSIHSKVVKSYLLFPTFEHMAESKNGRIFMRYLRHLMFTLLPLVMLFNLFPLFIQNFLLNIYCRIASIPHSYVDIIRNFINPFIVHNVTSMALEEMLQVRERDNKTLENNIKLIKLYYGATDGWTPFTFYHDIKRDIPNIDAEVCDKGFPHAFVLRDSKPMATLIVDWMKMH